MRFSTLAAALLLAAPLVASSPAKGSQAYAEGRALEQRKDWSAALAQYQKAAAEDPANLLFQIAVYRAGFEARQAQTEAARSNATGTDDPRARIARIQAAPELRPLNTEPIDLKLVNQSPKTMFESVCKYAGISLVTDPEYQPGKNLSLDVKSATVNQALDFLASTTRSFWKPLSSNTIMLTNDNPNKRRDYEELVTRTFYLSNLNTPAELQEIVTTIRTIADLQRVTVCNNQFAIIARGEADKMALAEKIVNDLDKPRSEVLVDILVLEATSTFSKQLSTALASTGLNVPVTFSPRSGIQVTTSSLSSSSSSATSAISLAGLGHLSSADYAVTLPGALLQAALSDARTKIMQAPQVRAVDNAKAVLKIGEREPIASGSYSAGVNATATNALVNTQFTYIDVGVNVELTPRVHEGGEVSIHIELEISSVTGQVSLGGINQPVIGQRKVTHDIRVREGEVSLLGGLINDSDSQTITGIPGLANIPFLRRFFTGTANDRSHSELMIAMVPHIIRRPDISPENVRTIGTGPVGAVKLTYSPEKR
jgi:general secretion pathway protein D